MFTVERLRTWIEAEPSTGQKVEDMHAPVARFGSVTAGQEDRKVDPSLGYLEHKSLQEVLVQVSLAVAVQEPDIVEKRPWEEFLLGDEVEGPSLLGGKQSAHRQLALGDGPIESP